MTEVQPGIYKHFKGNYYEVLGTAENTEWTHTDDLEWNPEVRMWVVYRPLYEGARGFGALVIRPAANFSQQICDMPAPNSRNCWFNVGQLCKGHVITPTDDTKPWIRRFEYVGPSPWAVHG